MKTSAPMNGETLNNAISTLSQELVNPRSLRDLRTLHLLTRRLERGFLVEAAGLTELSNAELCGWLLMSAHMLEQDAGMRERARAQGEDYLALIASEHPYPTR